MATKKEKTEINFQIIAVEIIEMCLINIDNSILTLNSFNFNINLVQSFLPEQKLIFVVSTIEVLDENKKTKLGSIKVNCSFIMDELQAYYNPLERKVSLPDVITTTLNSIAVSTCRGVMASQFKGTVLHNAVLPLLDPNTFSFEAAVKKK
jgi:hypothetical protein